MSNPNTVTVFSPEGEPFEMSRVNARDLCAHRGWSMTATAARPAPKKEAEDAVADSAGSVEDAATEITETEAPAEDEAEVVEEAVEEVTAEVGVKVFTTADEFDELPTREDVVAYLAATFPDFKPHHKSSRDGLIAKAIELAAG